MPRITVQISTKKVKFLKKFFGVSDITQKIQKIIDDHINYIVETKYRSNKTINEKIDELSK